MHHLERVVGWLVATVFAFFVLATFWQVVSRYLLGDSLGWIDEACRFGFIWMVFLAAAIGARRGTHMAITLLEEVLGPRSRRPLLVLADVSLIAFAVLVGWGGYQLMGLNWTSRAPATGIAIAWVQLILPVFGVLTAIFAADHLVRVAAGRIDESVPDMPGDGA